MTHFCRHENTSVVSQMVSGKIRYRLVCDDCKMPVTEKTRDGNNRPWLSLARVILYQRQKGLNLSDVRPYETGREASEFDNIKA